MHVTNLSEFVKTGLSNEFAGMDKLTLKNASHNTAVINVIHVHVTCTFL